MKSTDPIDILSPEEIAKGIPERVYIVGSGPNGREHWRRIPEDTHVILVNRAIMIEGFCYTRCLWWLCEDDTLPDQEWFTAIIEGDRTKHPVDERGLLYSWPLRYLAGFTIPKLIFRRDGRTHRTYPSDYVFTHTAIWDTACRKTCGEEPPFQAPFTYGGATISCRAVQIAAHRGAKEIVLVGVDMSGPRHFDWCSTAIKGESRKGHWKQLERFNTILRWVQENSGCVVSSLSPTALDIEMRKSE